MSTPLVLLHPLGSDRHFWDPIIPYLGSRELIALDLPGHGENTELASGAGVDDLAFSVLGALDARGVGDADVAGISLGGLVAQRLAARAPRRVRRVLLVDTLAVYPPPMRGMWAGRSAIVRASGTAAVVDATLGVWFTDDFVASADEAAQVVVQGVVQTLRGMPAEAYARTCELLAGVDLRDDLERIQAPTLVVRGRDESPPFVDGANALVESIRDAQLVLLDGKHAAALEHPAQFGSIVTSFCDSPECADQPQPGIRAERN